MDWSFPAPLQTVYVATRHENIALSEGFLQLSFLETVDSWNIFRDWPWQFMKKKASELTVSVSNPFP